MLKEKFLVFVKSSFSEDKKNELFAYIWKNYRKKISFYISNMIPARHPQFEDLFQEVMLKICISLHTFNPAHSFKAWIYTISRNQCLDFLKSKAEKLKPYQCASEDDMPDRNSPERIAIRNEIHEKIDQCINSLNLMDREIAYLRFYENLKYREISKIVNLNMNSTKARIRLIKIKLRKDLRRVL